MKSNGKEVRSTMVSGHRFISQLKPEETLVGTYLVRDKNLGTGKTGKKFVTATLADRSGTIDCRIWDQAEELFQKFSIDNYVAVEGTVQTYQNRRQLVVRKIESVSPDLIDPAAFLPATLHDVEALYVELVQLLETIEHPDVRWLALRLIQHPEIASRYKRAPAARTIHHAWVGGLLEHSLSVVKLSDFLGRFYPMVDRSYLMFGAAFHDFGKIFELKYDTSLAYTLEGRLVGHLVTGVAWIDYLCRERADFPEEVKLLCEHLIVAHHGKLEHGSPKLPATMEAVVLGLIDNLDSKVSGITSFLENEEVKAGTWSGYHSFHDTYYYLPTHGALTSWIAQKEMSDEKSASQAESLGTLVPEELRAQLLSMAKK